MDDDPPGSMALTEAIVKFSMQKSCSHVQIFPRIHLPYAIIFMFKEKDACIIYYEKMPLEWDCK